MAADSMRLELQAAQEELAHEREGQRGTKEQLSLAQKVGRASEAVDTAPCACTVIGPRILLIIFLYMCNFTSLILTNLHRKPTHNSH